MIPHINVAEGYGVKVQVGNLTVDYTLLHTTAPEPYDYGGITIYDGADADGNDTKRDRWVLIPNNRVNEQFARNASGMHGTRLATEDEADGLDIAERLMRHMRGYRWSGVP